MISKKVCLLGDFSVGKTSLVRRFVYDQFDDRYISTIGVKVSRKAIVLPGVHEPVELSMLIWDLAGSEEFDRVRGSYMRGASGGILVCDMTRRQTLDGLRTYADDLHSVAPDARVVVVANKADLIDQQTLAVADVAALAQDLNAPSYTTSAKTGEQVDEMFRHLGRLLIASVAS